MQRTKQQALMFLLGAVLVGGVLGFSAERALHEDRDGDYLDPVDPSLDQPWDGQRRGAYVEAVYVINRRWEPGYRFDRLWADDEGPFGSDFDPRRHSLMLAWRSSPPRPSSSSSSRVTRRKRLPYTCGTP